LTRLRVRRTTEHENGALTIRIPHPNRLAMKGADAA
jgi:hypothetical protein